MQLRSPFLVLAIISLGLAILGLSVSCLEPQRGDFLEHQDAENPDFHPE